MTALPTRERYVSMLRQSLEVDVVALDERIGARSGVRGRVGPPSAFRLKFVGLVCMFFASIVVMASSRPGPTPATRDAPVALRTVGYGFGGLGLGALALGFRLQRVRTADVWISLPSSARPPTAEQVAALAGDVAELRALDGAWKPDQVWLVMRAQLDPDTREAARQAQFRCFVASADSHIVEV